MLSTVALDDAPTWRVAKGTTLVRSFESSGRMELQSVSVKVDGNEQDTGPAVELSIAQENSCDFSDVIESVDGGRPKKLVRLSRRSRAPASRGSSRPSRTNARTRRN